MRTREREHGDPRPKALEGDRRSDGIEANHKFVLAAFRPDCDALIEEVRAGLAAKGLVSDFGTIKRLFERHGSTREDCASSEQDLHYVLKNRDA